MPTKSRLQGHKTPIDTEDAYLEHSKKTRLRTVLLPFLDDMQTYDRVEATLNDVGVNDYGNLLNYAKGHYFSDLPGIDAHMAESIHHAIEFFERKNKLRLEDKFHQAQDALSNLERVAKQPTEVQSGEGRKTALSM